MRSSARQRLAYAQIPGVFRLALSSSLK